MAKPDATVYVRLEQMQRYMSGWSGCNGLCPAGADATVYVRLERMQRYMSGWSECNGICPAGADATVYVWLERMQRYMSGFCLHVSGPDIYRCFCSNLATVTGF